MSGTVELAGTRWWVSSGVFYWAIDTAAERAGDADAAAALREVSDDNLGWLAVDDLAPGVREAVLGAFVSLPEVAERDIPLTPARDDVLAQVRELAELAAAAAQA